MTAPTDTDPLAPLLDDLAAALAPVAGSTPDAVRAAFAAPPRPGMGDLALPAFTFAKALQITPPELATRLSVVAADVEGVASAAAAGPFCNITWDTGAVAARTIEAVRAAAGDPWGMARGHSGDGRRLLMEYSSPNAARKLAFHHLRGTVIGAALARLYEAQGYDVVRLNFLGDWGHNIGLLLWKLGTVPDGSDATLPAERLQQLYVEANVDEENDPDTVKPGADEWLAKFDAGDPVALARWNTIIDSTTAALDATYERLGVQFDEYRGEHRYVRSALEVANELVAAGVAEVDPANGSIFVPGSDGQQNIVLVNNRGISTYEGRDCAAARDRYETFAFDRSIYVTDVGQGGRFRAFFAALVRAGWAWASGLEHVGIGLMRIGGSKAKTRKGQAYSLDDVLDEATERAADEITKRSDDRTADLADPAEVARQVGIGCVVFSQMRMRRNADFDFDIDTAVSLRGETAARVQYTVARINSMLDKGGTDRAAALAAGDPALLADPLEAAVALAIAGFGSSVRRAVNDNDPSHVTDGVLAIADAWGAYQSAGRDRHELRVLCDDATMRAARLALGAAVAATITDGLRILGVDAPERM